MIGAEMYAAALDRAEADLDSTVARVCRRRPGAVAEIDQAAAMVRDVLTDDGQPLTRERLGRHWLHVTAGNPRLGISRREYALTVAGIVQLARTLTTTEGDPHA